MSHAVLFKFRPVDKHLIESLVKSQLYFATPAHLNDPHDCRVDIRKSLDNAIRTASPTQQALLLPAITDAKLWSALDKVLSLVGICSFSMELLNAVQWSHYADQHRGVCLTYTIPDRFVTNRANGVTGRCVVEYGVSPMEDFLRTFAFTTTTTPIDFAEEIAKKALTIKGKGWEYEQEIRMIRLKVGPFDLPPEFLTRVSFGLNTPPADRDLVRRLVDSRYPSVAYGEVQRGASDFELIAVDI